MKLDKIISYAIKINPLTNTFQLKLKMASSEEHIDVNFKNAIELSATAELLRNEKNTYFDIESKDIIIEWEPTGENDPKYSKIR